MKKEKRKAAKLEIALDLKKASKYHFVGELSNVFFPYEPYPQQTDVVASIQRAIGGRENALIESPTGTGKTLCLLVGALSGLMNGEGRKKVYYLTRTHSQISQVINEFRQTVYACSLNVIASREQLCINHNLSQLRGKPLEKACAQLCQQKLCAYRDSALSRVPKPLQLHQFKEVCRKQLVCPYFYSKQLTERCELTIMPFNYLLEWNLFEKNSIDLKDSVIIFDEAHNIDVLCEQGSDIRLCFDSLAQAMNELRALIKVQSKKFLHKQFKESSQECQEVEDLKEQLQTLLNRLRSQVQISFFSRNEFIQKMEQFTTTSKQEGLDLGNYSLFCSKARKILKLFYKRQMPCEYLQLSIDIIEKIYYIANHEAQFKKFSITIAKGQLFFRCLDPSLCFKRLTDSKPRTIILSSGTMGNLDLWEKNLQIPFKHKVTTQSYITSNQLYAQVKHRSEKGVTFNFSFQGKQSEKQFQQICREICRLEKIIEGGIIVAFSNYDLLEKTLKYCHLLTRKIFFQTKGGNVDQVYRQYSQEVKKQGAILFIIMKGRFSEGINFANDLCRCLLIVGIPFLPYKDPGVVEKMKFLELNQTKADSELWYTEQSFKALNQTLGRAIRNKEDHAVILLFDQRYLKEENIKHLSGWFTKCLRATTNNYQHINDFISEAPWLSKNSTKEVIQSSTKNKKQPKLCDRLLQFSTPSKSNRKKLKLVMESSAKRQESSDRSEKSEQKQKESKPALELKEIVDVYEEPVYKRMSDEMIKFFLQSQQKVEECNTTLRKTDANEDELDETVEEIPKCFISNRSYGKRRISLDF